MNNQKFRFCCGCQRFSLILDGHCYYCNSTFIVHGVKSEAHSQNIKNYYKRKKNKNVTLSNQETN